MRTRFICSLDNEAALKALFKLRDDELAFTRAIKVALETEEAAKVAKEMEPWHLAWYECLSKSVVLQYCIKNC